MRIIFTSLVKRQVSFVVAHTFPCCSMTQRGDIKIFDFGLAKELANLEKDENGTYKLTGMSKWDDE